MRNALSISNKLERLCHKKRSTINQSPLKPTIKSTSNTENSTTQGFNNIMNKINNHMTGLKTDFNYHQIRQAINNSKSSSYSLSILILISYLFSLKKNQQLGFPLNVRALSKLKRSFAM